MTELFQALSTNDFETAFELLERTLQITREPQQRAQVALELAGVYALFGAGGLDGLQHSLEQAILAVPEVQLEPRYLALQANVLMFILEEILEPNDPQRAQVVAMADKASLGDAITRFYAASALVGSGESERGLLLLEQIRFADLPVYLQWRAWSWRAGAFEELGRLRDASLAYHHAANGATGSDRAALLQDKAAMLLDLEEPHEALIALEQSLAAVFGIEHPSDAAARLQLEARAHLMLENPHLAREHAEQAMRIETSSGEHSFPTALVLAQTLAALEVWQEAIPTFQRAVQLAQAGDKGFALHELGLAQLDADQPDDARNSLKLALLESVYPHKAEIRADLAELEYRLGNFEIAEKEARTALEMGATVPASLMLANVAYEYYRLDEALEHYRRALEHSSEGNRDWVIAHQMTADTLVQLGWRNPEQILHHASLALPHLEPADEWAITLESYIERARQLIVPSSHSRTLN